MCRVETGMGLAHTHFLKNTNTSKTSYFLSIRLKSIVNFYFLLFLYTRIRIHLKLQTNWIQHVHNSPQIVSLLFDGMYTCEHC